MSIDFQTLFNNFAAAAKAESLADKPIITLGELIAKLEAKDAAAELAVQYFDQVLGYGNAESYRGYYSDLSIDPISGSLGTVADALKDLRAAVGQTFTGYKGGEYKMTNRTLVWVAQWSTCPGLGVTGVEVIDGVVVITSADCEN
jgi:hypothetical protein